MLSNFTAATYYDGEYMELSFEGKQLKVRVGGEMLELFSAEVPENIHVRESVVGYLSIEVVRPCVSRDFPGMFRRGSFNALVQTFMSDKAFAEDPTAVTTIITCVLMRRPTASQSVVSERLIRKDTLRGRRVWP